MSSGYSSNCSLQHKCDGDGDGDCDLINELNDLKTKTYNESSRIGFNPNDGYFYTGLVDDSLEEIIYRDESDNLSTHFIDERFKRHAANVYKKSSIPFNVSNFFEDEIMNDDTIGGTPSQENISKYNPTVEQLKNVLKENNLHYSGKKQDLINRLIARNIKLPEPKQKNTKQKNNSTKSNSNNSTRSNKKKRKNVDNNSTRSNKKKRKNVDNNSFELIVALILKYKVSSVSDINNLIETDTLYEAIGLDSKYTCDKFIEDYKIRLPKIVDKYLTTFNLQNANNLINLDNIEIVKLSGKGCNKDEKSDVFFKYKGDGGIYGVSVKQSKDATLSNYSVNLILDDIKGNSNISKQLQTIKLQYISEQGLNINDKQDRAKIGKHFYNHFDNPYWNAMRVAIKENSNEIGTHILNSVFCTKTDTKVYEYDGNSLSEFNPICIPNADIVEDENYYYKYNKKQKKNIQRKAAKMFYNLTIGGVVRYRCEIRHKGSWSASPQFMLFKL